MTSRTRPHFALVGPGSAATAIARALVARGWRAVAVAGRAVDAPSTRRLALELDASAVETAKAGNDARLVVIAVPDDVIGAVAASLAPDVAGGTLVIHLSGAWGLDALGPLTDARAGGGRRGRGARRCRSVDRSCGARRCRNCDAPSHGASRRRTRAVSRPRRRGPPNCRSRRPFAHITARHRERGRLTSGDHVIT